MRRSSSRNTRKTMSNRRRFSPSDASEMPCDGKVMAPGTIRSDEDFSIQMMPDSEECIIKIKMPKNDITMIPVGKNEQGVLYRAVFGDPDEVSDSVRERVQQISNKLNGGRTSNNSIFMEILELKSKVESLTREIFRLTAEIESLKSEVQKH